MSDDRVEVNRHDLETVLDEAQAAVPYLDGEYQDAVVDAIESLDADLNGDDQ